MKRGILQFWKTTVISLNINRIYYLYDIPMGADRGGHGHYELQQYIVAASGSFTSF
jgi:hypothetical protein